MADRTSKWRKSPRNRSAGPPCGKRLMLMAEWRKETDEDFNLIHDMSSPMVKETKFWEALTDKSMEPTTIGYGPKTMQFPIGVAKTSFEDSRAWAGLQLADVLAGSVARSLTMQKLGKPDPYVRLVAATALNLLAPVSVPGTLEDWPETPDNYAPPVTPLNSLVTSMRRLDQARIVERPTHGSVVSATVSCAVVEAHRKCNL